MGPSIFGVGVYYLNLTVGNILASLLPQGSVSYLYYAQRLFEFPQGIFTVSVAQAVLPSMSRQAAAGDIEALKDSLQLRAAADAFHYDSGHGRSDGLATPIFSLLFMGGAFDYAKAVACGRCLGAVFVRTYLRGDGHGSCPGFLRVEGYQNAGSCRFCGLYCQPDLQSPVDADHAACRSCAGFFHLCRRLEYAPALLSVAPQDRPVRRGNNTVAAGRSLLAAIPACLAAALILRQLDWSQSGRKTA